MLNDTIFNELESIKTLIIESNRWPKSLSGACNVTSILVQGLLEKYNIDSTLVNNHKHAFCLLNFDDSEWVLDLTASQISRTKFSEYILFKPLYEVVNIADSTVRGQGFYSLQQKDNYFFAMGKLSDVLKVNEEIYGDEVSLYRILQTVCQIRVFDINTRIELSVESVNNFAKEVINLLIARPN